MLKIMKNILGIIVLIIIFVHFDAFSITKETQEVYDSISLLELRNSYPFSLQSINENGDTIETVISNEKDFLNTPAFYRFWICDLITGKYWKNADMEFDFDFGLYSATNRSFSHGKTYILILFKGHLSVYDWNNSMAIMEINERLTDLKYNDKDRLRILDNIFANNKYSGHYIRKLINKQIIVNEP